MTKRVAVTGAAGALGSKVCTVLAEQGWQVIGIDVAHAPGLAFAGLDLTDETAVGRVAAEIAAGGPLQGLVNIAGGFRWEKLADGAVATFDQLFRLNVKTALVTSKALLPLLRDGKGAIVNIGAAGGLKGGLGTGAYAASKAGVHRLTEALAEELKDEGVRVNAVLPSIIDTAANRADMPEADFSRWVAPAELAAVIAFLLSPAASAVTGALLPVTGRV